MVQRRYAETGMREDARGVRECTSVNPHGECEKEYDDSCHQVSLFPMLQID
jgi:hypothetical protein